MKGKLESKTRYLQIAFNYDASMVRQVLPSIPFNKRIMIEAGTPYIKEEGMDGVRLIRRYWKGHVVADLKTADGALDEVRMAKSAGATAVTVLGNSPTETLDLFIERCSKMGMISMVDMLGVKDPLKVMMRLKHPPDVMVLHKGRDEESTRGKMIQYRHVNRVKSKFDVLISAAGGVGINQARSAIFNGASIVVANLVRPGDPWIGIPLDDNVGAMAREFLESID